VPLAGQQVSIEASPEEREALAQRLDLPALHALTAELELRPTDSGRVSATGRMRAEVEQTCVVTLEPFRSAVETPLDWMLLPPGEEPGEGFDGPDEVESEASGTDLGEALAQALSLSLDPYPRRPGATLPAEAAGGARSPFAALAKLRTLR